jgi:hypothetical protein
MFCLENCLTKAKVQMAYSSLIIFILFVQRLASTLSLRHMIPQGHHPR